MTHSRKRDPKYLLNLFTSGSLIVLLICLCSTALVFSATFIKKERERAAISTEQMSNFFSFQYRSFSEEMWTASYESIEMRVKDIANQFGHASYEMILANPVGSCVYQGNSNGFNKNCEMPKNFKDQIKKFSSDINFHPVLKFDPVSNRYQYMTPLYIGAISKGFLFVSLSDPYGYYRGTTLLLAAKIFLPAILCLIWMWYLWVLISKRFILRPYLTLFVSMERKQALGDLAAQVAHDYQSPLASLKAVIRGLKELSIQQRLLLNSSVSRIESLSNDLMIRYKDKNEIKGNHFTFVSAVVDAILAEKTATLANDSAIELQCTISPDALVSGVAISQSELSRILSNIINNAIEAVKNRLSGLIKVAVEIKNSDIIIDIQDNGIGMSSEILHKVKTIGGTYEKPKGSGLGIQHAKGVLARIGGIFSIDSIVDQGTCVSLKIPIKTPPLWCAQSIVLGEDDKVVVLDDDTSVHLLWKEKLSGFDVVFISDPEEFDLAHFPICSTRYIFDHDIIGSPVTGLDLIRNNHLGARATLVTSYFNEPKIQIAVQETRAKILAKFMISDIKIEKLLDKARKTNDLYDMVLIDDDPLIHRLWTMCASVANKKLLVLMNADNFKTYQIGYDTLIYIDKKLGSGIDGFEVAKQLSDQGYKNIFITTGYQISESEKPSYVAQILGKEFPS